MGGAASPSNTWRRNPSRTSQFRLNWSLDLVRLCPIMSGLGLSLHCCRRSPLAKSALMQLEDISPKSSWELWGITLSETIWADSLQIKRNPKCGQTKHRWWGPAHSSHARCPRGIMMALELKNGDVLWTLFKPKITEFRKEMLTEQQDASRSLWAHFLLLTFVEKNYFLKTCSQRNNKLSSQTMQT